MNNLKTNYAGKAQLFFEDLDWMQNATIQALYNVVRSIGADNTKLHGCIADDTTITSGAVVINGQILVFDGSTGDYTSGTWWFVLDTNYDDVGDRTFLDGTPNGTNRQVYEINKAVVIESGTQPANSISVNADYIFDHTHDPDEINTDNNNLFVTDIEKTAWNNKANAAAISNLNLGTFAANDPLKLIDHGSYVQLTGFVRINAAAVVGNIGKTLSFQQKAIAMASNSHLREVTVGTNGDIYLSNARSFVEGVLDPVVELDYLINAVFVI